MIKSGKKKWLVNTALLMGSLLVSVIIVEIFFRIIGFSYLNFQEYNDLVGRKPWPNAEGWFQEEGKVYIIDSKDSKDELSIKQELEKILEKIVKESS